MPPRHNRTYRSRKIWNETRKPDSPCSALIRAILYELQPIRLDESTTSAIHSFLTRAVRSARILVTEIIPSLIKFAVKTLRQWTRKEWCIVFGIMAYWQFVRFLHSTLDAGPMVLMFSALTAIFTIGLGDNIDPDGISAYSVFNRGFNRILGSIDVENLVAQHVGGALAVQAQQININNDNDNNDNIENERNEIQDDMDNNDRQLQEPLEPNIENDLQNQPRSRRSGKKARRENLERRRELERQRQAAAAFGFVGEGEDQDFAALDRLVLQDHGNH